MHDWASIVNILGRFLLASYFLKAGIQNALNWKNVLGLVKSKSLPFPSFILVMVILTEIFGSLAIIFNYHAIIASVALIIFTLASNFLICNYWRMEGLQRRNISFLFYANIAVIGALLIVSGIA